MTTVVFAGPSLHGSPGPTPPGIELRPPAALGDLTRASRAGATVIGLIDGRFEAVQAVWHKEILWLLERGIAVYGGASMGALRAAELASFGMCGVGQIYAAFARGELDADDEVAVLHGPAETGFLPLSVALVDIRATLDAACKMEVIDVSAATRLTALAKAVFYKERTWGTVLACGGGVLSSSALENLRRWILTSRVDAKRHDAEELLAVLANPARRRASATISYERPHLVVDLLCQTLSVSAPTTAALLDFVRLEPAAYARRCREALLMLLALDEAARRRLDLEINAALDRLRDQEALHRAAALRDWLAAREMSRTELEQSLRGEAAIANLIEQSRSAIDALVVDMLKLEPDYLAFQKAARNGAEQSDAAGQVGGTAPEPAKLVAWYCAQRHIPLPPSPGTLGRELGFGSAAEFHAALHTAWLLREEADG